mgnify:CR=1 FL=1
MSRESRGVFAQEELQSAFISFAYGVESPGTARATEGPELDRRFGRKVLSQSVLADFLSRAGIVDSDIGIADLSEVLSSGFSRDVGSSRAGRSSRSRIA